MMIMLDFNQTSNLDTRSLEKLECVKTIDRLKQALFLRFKSKERHMRDLNKCMDFIVGRSNNREANGIFI